jgi:hypothetical protein
MESDVLLRLISDNYNINCVAVLQWVEGEKISRNMIENYRGIVPILS